MPVLCQRSGEFWSLSLKVGECLVCAETAEKQRACHAAWPQSCPPRAPMVPPSAIQLICAKGGPLLAISRDMHSDIDQISPNLTVSFKNYGKTESTIRLVSWIRVEWYQNHIISITNHPKVPIFAPVWQHCVISCRFFHTFADLFWCFLLNLLNFSSGKPKKRVL